MFNDNLRVVYKQTLAPINTGEIVWVKIHHNAEILSAAIQIDELVIWFLCRPDAPVVSRGFMITGTGFQYHNLDAKNFIATVFDGPYVRHIFEVS